jgi:hypothetical protein
MVSLVGDVWSCVRVAEVLVGDEIGSTCGYPPVVTCTQCWDRQTELREERYRYF